MKRSTRFIVAGALVALVMAVMAVLTARNIGTDKPSSDAGPLPTEPALVPIATLVANVLNQKTPPSDFLTSVSKPNPVRTRNPEYYTNTVDEAISRAAQQLTGERGVVSRVRLDNVSYVQTTAGQALMLFDDSYLRNLASYDMTRDTPVWAFVALGSFRPAVWDRLTRPTDALVSLPAMWVVVPQGGYDFALGDPTIKIPDLTTLGKPIEIKRGQAPGTDLDTVRAPSGESTPTPGAPPPLAPVAGLGIAVGAPSLSGGKVRVPVNSTGTGVPVYSAFNIHLRWNSAVFSFDSANLTGGVIPSGICAAFADSDGGGARYACIAGAETTATGLLATIVLSPAASGCSSLHLFTLGAPDNGDEITGTFILRPDGEALQPAQYVDGSANVGGQVC
jgi:hypothetical protein